MRIICISGVDSSGKSTQASLLYMLLNRFGFKVGYLWLRWFAFLTYLLYILSVLVDLGKDVVVSASVDLLA